MCVRSNVYTGLHDSIFFFPISRSLPLSPLCLLPPSLVCLSPLSSHFPPLLPLPSFLSPLYFISYPFLPSLSPHPFLFCFSLLLPLPSFLSPPSSPLLPLLLPVSFLLSLPPGMTDLLAPLLAALDDEAEAFWCFTKLVEGTAFFRPANNHVSVERQLVSKQLNLAASPYVCWDCPCTCNFSLIANLHLG